MLEHKTKLSSTLTAELEEAFSTFREKLEWMLQQGWKGQWVAISGREILGHGKPKRVLATMHESLYQEKKLLLRKVLPQRPKRDIELW